MTPKPQQVNGDHKEEEETSGYRLSHPPAGEEVCISGAAGFFPDSQNMIELRDNLFGKVSEHL